MKRELSAEPNQMLVNLSGLRVINDKHNILLHLRVLLCLNKCLLNLIKSDEQKFISIQVFNDLHGKRIGLLVLTGNLHLF